jgi:hypothetical protein
LRQFDLPSSRNGSSAPIAPLVNPTNSR